MDKKRRHLWVLVSLPVLVIVYAAIVLIELGMSSPANAAVDTSPIMTFSVLGDIHTDTVRLKAALYDLYSIDPKMAAVVLNGDIVDQGEDSQYETVSRCLEDSRAVLPGTVIYNIGNHEFYNYAKGVNTLQESDEFISRFLSFSKEKEVYHDLWLNGYHLISLGSEETYTKEMGPVAASISKVQMEWLKDKLAENFVSHKPIFVFLHQPLEGNVINSRHSWGDVKQDKELREILAKYPEVIMISSHTHSLLDFDGPIHEKSFKIATTGAVHNPVYFDKKGGRKIMDTSQGIYIEVFKDRVLIKGRDFKSRTWLGEAAISY